MSMHLVRYRCKRKNNLFDALSLHMNILVDAAVTLRCSIVLVV